jgi:SAM-dependent methyltransferase
VLDVGSGTGALAAWVAQRLRAELHLVDRDPAVRAVALRAFPDVQVHAELDEVGPATATLVMGMEILEHIPPAEQLAFLRRLFARVEPGGLLVLSTPDESGYLGGWSGYAPHVGPVDATTLTDLLRLATDGAEARVWRMEGDPYHLGPVRRVAQPVANRVWTRLGPLLGPLAQRVARPAAGVANVARRYAGPELVPRVRAIVADHGRGTGLIGVASAG